MKQKKNHRYSKTVLTILCIVFSAVTAVTATHAAEDLTHITGNGGTIFFAWDGESGSYNADAGTGRFAALGGNASGQEGNASADCASSSINTSSNHYTILDSAAAAQSAVDGSVAALKTPYDGNCNNESTQRDSTAIALAADQKEVYIRWYQKFTGNWMNGSVQHKFTKITPQSVGKMSDGYTTGYFTFSGNSRNLQLNKVNNVEGQFNGDGVTNRSNVCTIYSSKGGAGNQYENVYRYWDNYNNGIGGTDGEFYFDTDRWYAIEMHIKVNSDAATADAEIELWVDGVKTFGLDKFRFYGPANSVINGVGYIEMQHIYYNRSTNDNQPTYMDNIVIANQYIGPANSGYTATKPAPPTGLRLITN